MAQRADAVIVNSLVRQALVAAQEVMGENGLNAVLRADSLIFAVRIDSRKYSHRIEANHETF